MKKTYPEALKRLLVHEGGYTNHPSDPGGPTNHGITIHDYRKYVKSNATASDVRAMPLAVAKTIYKAKYWDAQRCDELSAGVDYAIFDYGVNSGIGRSRKVLQRVVGVKDDGVIGPETMKAVLSRDPAKLVNAICDERLAFLKRLRTWPVFGKGWGSRVYGVRTYGLKLATGAVSLEVPIPAPSEGKGFVPAPTGLEKAIKVGLPGAGAGGALGWQDWVLAHPYEVGLIAVGGIVVLAGGLYALSRWHQYQQEKPTPGLIPVPAN